MKSTSTPFDMLTRRIKTVRRAWGTWLLTAAWLTLQAGCGGDASTAGTAGAQPEASNGGGATDLRQGGGPTGAVPSWGTYGAINGDNRVAVIVDQAEVLDEAGTAERLGIGTVLTPRREEGGKLRVRHSRRVGWLAKDQTIPLADAVGYFTRKIRDDPSDARLVTARGLAHMALERSELASADFDDAISLEPKLARAYYNQGLLSRYRVNMELYKKAIELDPQFASAHVELGRMVELFGSGDPLKHVMQAVEADPDRFGAYELLADIYEKRNDYDHYFEAVNHLVRLDPEDPEVLNRRAWSRATCSQSKHRNGGEAVADATKACEIDGWREPDYLDTLAAAFAESGDFGAAVRRETEAIDRLAEDADELSDFQKRLELYRAGAPHRE